MREQRSGADLFYFDRGDKVDVAADVFSNEVRVLIDEHGGGNKRLAVDKIMLHGLRALEAQGFEIMEGEEVTEKTRAIKGPDEILAMRCASHACETAVAEMEKFARANVGTARPPRMTSGPFYTPRTSGAAVNGSKPACWPRASAPTRGFRNAAHGSRNRNEIIAFDTDLIGSYGICIDISRTWWIGDQKPRPDMVYAMQHAHEHIMTNMEMLKPGVMIPELTANAHKLDDKFQAQKYGCLMHGVGLCDEWPLVAYPDKAVAGSYDYPLEPGMVLCVEAAVGEVGGDFSIKLEDQVLITEDGYENLTTYPFDPQLDGTGISLSPARLSAGHCRASPRTGWRLRLWSMPPWPGLTQRESQILRSGR